MHRETLDVVEKHLRLCSRYDSVNYGAWRVLKLWFGSSVTTSLIPKFHFELVKKKDSSRDGQAKYNLEDGVTVLAQPYVFSTLIEHAFSTDGSTRYIRALS